ncbi:hypothetical protein ABB28_10255 [Stenotrophomonas chelatiphaga]|uniref:Uncharacterized protein n=1 Tax=Stenotrophomonas chelatiphaga TaxID=517011 RepID=A0A0R0D502_9GAMM|nr:hypothetical protein ABB28_10255 [Stenotrophomonas chelatiphaga]
MRRKRGRPWRRRQLRPGTGQAGYAGCSSMPLLCRRAGARGRPMLSQGSWRGCEASLPWLNRPSAGPFAASGR